MIAGQTPQRPNPLAQGSYFSGRKPEDGRIDWSQPAASVYNLIRAVAPPYPGAFTTLKNTTLRILRTRTEPRRSPASSAPAIYARDDACFAVCRDGSELRLVEMEYEGKPFSARDFLARFGTQSVLLDGGQK